MRINVHKNHTASCLCCIHLEMREDGPFSELDQVGFVIECAKRKFPTNYYVGSADREDLLGA